jgi:hypothetical protein
VINSLLVYARGKRSPAIVFSSRHRPMVEGSTVKVLSEEAESFLTMRVKRPCSKEEQCRRSRCYVRALKSTQKIVSDDVVGPGRRGGEVEDWSKMTNALTKLPKSKKSHITLHGNSLITAIRHAPLALGYFKSWQSSLRLVDSLYSLSYAAPTPNSVQILCMHRRLICRVVRYVIWYFGPSPPCGVVQVMSCVGTFMSQVLQCIQLQVHSSALL